VRRLLLAGLLLLAACGDDDDEPDESGSTTATTEVAPSSTTAGGGPSSTTSDTQPVDPDDALAAARAWLDLAFPGNTATTGEFQQGDARSGEVQVFRSREDGTQGALASTLLLRLDDADEWQVFAALSEIMIIEDPLESLAPGATVSGVGRGFEGAIVIRAVGLDGTEHGLAAAQGGSGEQPAPFSAELGLDGVEAGDEVYLVVSGGVGLEGDTGEFSMVRLPVAAG
jgi:hypothetical protein